MCSGATERVQPLPPILVRHHADVTSWGVLYAGKQTCFVPLLPPKETTIISSTEALDFQLGYRPAPAHVVAFSEVQSLFILPCNIKLFQVWGRRTNLLTLHQRDMAVRHLLA